MSICVNRENGVEQKNIVVKNQDIPTHNQEKKDSGDFEH